MAIQLRRGAYTDLNINALLPGEAAVVLSGDPNTDSGKAFYICFSTGEVQRIGTSEEVDSIIEQIDSIVEQIGDVEEIIPKHWSGNTTVDSSFKLFLNESTYTGIKLFDTYTDNNSGKTYFVTNVMNIPSPERPILVELTPIDGTFVSDSAPSSAYGGRTWKIGTKWLNKTTGKYYFLKSFTVGTPPSNFVWVELTDPSWEQLATVDVEDLSDTPDGFIWDVDNYDDLKIIINGVTSVTGNRNIDLRLTTSGGASEHIGMFANLINQTSKDIKLKATRNTGTATMELTGSIMRSAYPYVDDASYNRDIAVPSGAITKVELIISGGGGLATGDITLLGRKRG